MNVDEITFNDLAQAVANLTKEVAEIKSILIKMQLPAVSSKRNPIGIDEACKVIGKAKSTIYSLVRKRAIPCYKNGKKLYFFEDELLTWIENGKRKTMLEIQEEAETNILTRRNRK